MEDRYIVILWLFLLGGCHAGLRQDVHPGDPPFVADVDRVVGGTACTRGRVDTYTQPHHTVYLMAAPRSVTPAVAVVAAVDAAIARWFTRIFRAINHVIPCCGVRDAAAQASVE